MTQIPRYFGARYPAVQRRSVPAMALWRSRDGITSPATDDTPITYTSVAGGVGIVRVAKGSTGALTGLADYQPAIHMRDLDNDGVLETPTLGVSSGDGNRCPYSEAINSWTAVNSASVLSPTLAVGQLSLQLISDTSGSLQSYYKRQINGTGLDARSVVSCFIGQGNISAAAGSAFQLYETTGSVVRAEATWTWSQSAAGVWTPNVTANTGQLMSVEYYGRHWYLHQTTNLLTWVDVWRVSVRTIVSFNPSNANECRVFPAFTASQQGNAFFGGVMVSERPSPYVKTAGTAVATPGIDSWSMAFDGVPQAMTLAVRMVYTAGQLCYVSGKLGQMVMVSDAAGSLPRLAILLSDGTGANVFTGQMADGVNPQVLVTLSNNASPDEVMLVWVALRGDGSLVIGQRLSDGSETTATSGNPYGLPVSWVANSSVRLFDGSKGSGHYLGVGVFAGEPTGAYMESVLR